MDSVQTNVGDSDVLLITSKVVVTNSTFYSSNLFLIGIFPSDFNKMRGEIYDGL